MRAVPNEVAKTALGDLLRLGELPAVQAALSGYSDLAMRRVARAHGCLYALNEVVLDRLVVERGKLRRRILAVPQDDHPVGGQLMGSDPQTFGAAARAMVEAGYDVVDINFGCPVSKVLGRCRGGWLLSQPDTALEMVQRVLDAVAGDVPVTVKMRRGYDDSAASEHAFFTILDGAFARGIAAVTVHGRSVRQKYVGPSSWEFVARVKRHVGERTVLGSGDLFSPLDVVRMIEQTGVDGVTVARGCIGNPFVFGQVRDLIAGRPVSPSTMAQQRDALRMHWKEARSLYGAARAVGPTRTHAIKYARYHPRPEWARDAFVATRSATELEESIESVFDPEQEAAGLSG